MSILRLLLAIGVFAATCAAQSLLLGAKPGETLHLQIDDAVLLDQEQSHDGLTCSVTPAKAAALDFDFTFHAGYDVTLPARELEPGTRLTVLMRVTPLPPEGEPHKASNKSESFYLFQRVEVPNMAVPNRGDGLFHGSFIVGEGQYRVKWMLRDSLSRACTRSWEFQAKLNPKDGAIEPRIEAGAVRPILNAVFGKDPPVERTRKDSLLKVKVIANFVPRVQNGSLLADQDIEVLIGILRRISQDPRIGEYSLTACSLATQRVFFQQESSSYIDYPALGTALKSMNLGLINAKQLAASKGPALFMVNLLEEEARKSDFDALILVGPKTVWRDKLPKEIANSDALDGRLFFYLSYDRDPYQNPWPDLLGSLVKKTRGIQYTISHPEDLFNAWTDVMSRVTKSKTRLNDVRTQ
jgi:hypothetical protein